MKLKRSYQRNLTGLSSDNNNVFNAAFAERMQSEAQISLATELLQAKALSFYGEDFYQKLVKFGESESCDEGENETIENISSQHDKKDPTSSLLSSRKRNVREILGAYACERIAQSSIKIGSLHLYEKYLIFICGSENMHATENIEVSGVASSGVNNVDTESQAQTVNNRKPVNKKYLMKVKKLFEDSTY